MKSATSLGLPTDAVLFRIARRKRKDASGQLDARVHRYGSMLLRAVARRGIMPAILLAAVFFHGCNSDQDVHYASAASIAEATPAATPQPTPNPDQAAGLILRFYRDVDANTKDSVKDLAGIISADFFRNHHDDFVADYGFISDPKVEIRSITDRTVTYTLDSIYLPNGSGKLFWERTGRRTLNHGSQSGWVLDNDAWDSVHLVGVSTPEHPDMTAVQDKVYSDGRHEFIHDGETLSFLAQGDNWHITTVSTPTPAPADNGADANVSSVKASSDNQQTAASYQAPPPPAVSADCEEVGVEGVYDDGIIWHAAEVCSRCRHLRGRTESYADSAPQRRLCAHARSQRDRRRHRNEARLDVLRRSREHR
jgi:hypothetical protein